MTEELDRLRKEYNIPDDVLDDGVFLRVYVEIFRPSVKGGPAGLNSLLEKVFTGCMKGGKGETVCSKIAWDAAKKAGWRKGGDGKWHKKSVQKTQDNVGY